MVSTPMFGVCFCLTRCSFVAGRYTCQSCGNRYNHIESLRHHEKMHDGLTRCLLCPKVYTKIANLRRHMICFHQMSAEQVRECVPGSRYCAQEWLLPTIVGRRWPQTQMRPCVVMCDVGNCFRFIWLSVFFLCISDGWTYYGIESRLIISNSALFCSYF